MLFSSTIESDPILQNTTYSMISTTFRIEIVGASSVSDRCSPKIQIDLILAFSKYTTKLKNPRQREKSRERGNERK